MIAFEPGVVDTSMQTFVRTRGRPGMLPDDHALFTGMHEQGQLRPPDDAGRPLAHVALRAPRDWSGTIVAWNDERVQRLITA